MLSTFEKEAFVDRFHFLCCKRIGSRREGGGSNVIKNVERAEEVEDKRNDNE